MITKRQASIGIGILAIVMTAAAVLGVIVLMPKAADRVLFSINDEDIEAATPQQKAAEHVVYYEPSARELKITQIAITAIGGSVALMFLYIVGFTVLAWMKLREVVAHINATDEVVQELVRIAHRL